MCWRSSIKDSLRWLKHPHFTVDVWLEAVCSEGLIRELRTVQPSICGLLRRTSTTPVTSHPSSVASTRSRAGAVGHSVRQLLLGSLTRFWSAAEAGIPFPHLKTTSLALMMRKMYRNHLVPRLAHKSGDRLSSPLTLWAEKTVEKIRNRKVDWQIGKSWA